MYIRFENGLVAEFISDIDPAFPDVSIEDRYPAEFVKELRYCDNEAEVELGMRCDAETDSYDYPPPPPPVADFGEKAAEDTGDITQAEINLEVEYRLSCLELGIK